MMQPDLILMDIGLPTINGIDAARRIKAELPGSKILFVSEHRLADLVREGSGASGYVLKSDVARDLVIAVQTVLDGDGEWYVSSSLRGSSL
jgi:DNA-binding NarL/FixJ family response regulator